ncbi:MAG TPA: class I SAM-dependent methyltransferase [Ktedonobacteraceae bacterium]|nr:class I SAM-dependent methyltransferase [Ktedonobacteraceae bacterium]
MGSIVEHYQEIHRTLEQQLFRALQDYLVEQGRLLPDGFDRSEVWQILDIACGTGQWVRDVANKFPDIEVVGLDINAEAIDIAHILTNTGRIENAAFMVGDMLRMMEIQDNSFDVVHARFLAPVVQTRLWPAVLQELLRVCRPGGKIIWTEATFPATNSPACFQWCELMQQALVQSGYTPIVTRYMERLLGDVSCCNIQRSETCIDISAETAFNKRIYRDAALLLSLIQPFLSHKNVASTEKIDRICREAIIDLYDDSFRGQWVLVTVTCEKRMSHKFPL